MPRPSYEQSVYLLEFMERHPQLARGRLQTADAREKANVLWRTLALELNSLGGCIKDVPTWKKYWNDKKANTKKNSAARYKSMRKTGGGVDKLPEPSEFELKILNLMGDEFGTGIEGVMVPPFPSQLAEGECSSGTPTTSMVAPVAMQSDDEGDGQPKDSPVAEIIVPFGNSSPDNTVLDHAYTHPAHMEEDTPPPNMAEHTSRRNTAPARRPRFRNALGFAREHLAAMEERRIDSQDRLARGVQEICAHLVATTNETSEVAKAQIDAARAQQEAAEAQGRAALDLSEAARALLEAVRAFWPDKFKH